MGESNRKREKVKARIYTRHCVSDALIFNLQNSKNFNFLCINAIKNDLGDKPYVGNLSKDLIGVGENNGEREKVRARMFTWNCVSDALIFDLQNSKNGFICV